MKIIASALFALVFSIPGIPAWAQNPNSISSAERQAFRADLAAAQARAGASSGSEDQVRKPSQPVTGIPAMEGDDEFGELVIIERQSNWQPWGVNIQSGFVRTDNAALAVDGFEATDSYLRSGLGVDYFPTIVGGLFGKIGFRQDFYHYDRYSDLNFDYLRANAGLFYSFPRHGTSDWLDLLLEDAAVFVNYNYSRVTENDLAEELFTNHSVNLGLQKNATLSRGHSLYYGISAEPSLDANPSTSRRHEYRWFLSYGVEWTPRIRTYLGYTGGNFDYHDSSRSDINHYSSLINRISMLQGYRGNTSWDCYLMIDANYELNDSNAEFRDYKNFNWGASLGLQLFF